MKRPYGGSTRLPFDIGSIRAALITDGQLEVRASISVKPQLDDSSYRVQSGSSRWVIEKSSNNAAPDELIVDGHVVRTVLDRQSAP